MEFHYHVDPRDGLFSRILSDLVQRLHRARTLDFGLSQSHDPDTSVLLTSDPDRFLDTPASLLFIGACDPGYDPVLALETDRVIATTRSLNVRLGLQSDTQPTLAELPASPAYAPAAAEKPPRFEIVHCSEMEGANTHPLGKEDIALIPALEMFAGLDLPCPVRLHLGDKPFAGLEHRAASSVAAGCLAADLSFDNRCDWGDLTPSETSVPIFGENRSLDNLSALHDCLSDPIYTNILLRRQQDLMPGFNTPREARIRDILRDRTPRLIEKLLAQTTSLGRTS